MAGWNQAELAADILAAINAAGAAPGPTGALAMANGIAIAITKQATINAIVSPAGVPAPMSNAGGPVVGTGKIV